MKHSSISDVIMKLENFNKLIKIETSSCYANIWSQQLLFLWIYKNTSRMKTDSTFRFSIDLYKKARSHYNWLFCQIRGQVRIISKVIN